jgi:hypothetical protein
MRRAYGNLLRTLFGPVALIGGLGKPEGKRPTFMTCGSLLLPLQGRALYLRCL